MCGNRVTRISSIALNETGSRSFAVESWMGNCCGAGSFSNFDVALFNPVIENHYPAFFSAVFIAAADNGAGYQPYNFFYILSNSQIKGGNRLHEFFLEHGGIEIHSWENEAHTSSGCRMFKWNIKSIIGKYIDEKGRPLNVIPKIADTGATASPAPVKTSKTKQPPVPNDLPF